MSIVIQRRLCLKALACSFAGASSALAEPADPGAGAQPSRGPERFEMIELGFEREANLAQRALVVVPRQPGGAAVSRLLVLLHGFASSDSESRGIWAWVRDAYALEAYRRLRHPPLVALPGSSALLSEERAKQINAELAGDRFRGFVLVCPYTPRPYARDSIADRYAAWLEHIVLPTVIDVCAMHPKPSIGLAGVSMGGRLSLELLMARPALFDAWSGVQAEMAGDEAGRYAERLSRALGAAGRRCALQVHTSTFDPYRAANEQFHRQLAERNVAAELRVSSGPHNCVWLREVGSVETLWFHDRALAPRKRDTGNARAHAPRVSG